MTKNYYDIAEMITTGWTYEEQHTCRGNLHLNYRVLMDDVSLCDMFLFENRVRANIYNHIFQEVAKDVDELRSLFIRQMVGYADGREQYEIHVMMEEKLKEMQNKLNWDGELDNEVDATK